MNEEESNKPTKGTWDNLGQPGDKLSFMVNEPQIVEFLTDKPEEKQSSLDENAVYYVFPVKLTDGTESKIETSAWTLLSELKALSPLKGKRVQVVKKLDKGKQKFSVVEVPKIIQV